MIKLLCILLCKGAERNNKELTFTALCEHVGELERECKEIDEEKEVLMKRKEKLLAKMEIEVLSKNSVFCLLIVLQMYAILKRYQRRMVREKANGILRHSCIHLWTNLLTGFHRGERGGTWDPPPPPPPRKNSPSPK